MKTMQAIESAISATARVIHDLETAHQGAHNLGIRTYEDSGHVRLHRDIAAWKIGLARLYRERNVEEHGG